MNRFIDWLEAQFAYETWALLFVGAVVSLLLVVVWVAGVQAGLRRKGCCTWTR